MNRASEKRNNRRGPSEMSQAEKVFVSPDESNAISVVSDISRAAKVHEGAQVERYKAKCIYCVIDFY